MSSIYKISYVVSGEDHPGAIMNTEKPPKKGETIQLGDTDFTVVEVIDLVPARGDFHYPHATVRPEES